MVLSEILATMFAITNILIGLWIFIDKKKTKRREDERQGNRDYTDNSVNSLRATVNNLSKQVNTLLEEIEYLKLENRNLTEQLITEHKVDSKLQPLKEEVEATKKELGKVETKLGASIGGVKTELSYDIKDLRDEFRSYAASNEANIQLVLTGVSELKGFLRAKFEG